MFRLNLCRILVTGLTFAPIAIAQQAVRTTPNGLTASRERRDA